MWGQIPRGIQALSIDKYMKGQNHKHNDKTILHNEKTKKHMTKTKQTKITKVVNTKTAKKQ